MDADEGCRYWANVSVKLFELDGGNVLTSCSKKAKGVCLILSIAVNYPNQF